MSDEMECEHPQTTRGGGWIVCNVCGARREAEIGAGWKPTPTSVEIRNAGRAGLSRLQADQLRADAITEITALLLKTDAALLPRAIAAIRALAETKPAPKDDAPRE